MQFQDSTTVVGSDPNVLAMIVAACKQSMAPEQIVGGSRHKDPPSWRMLPASEPTLAASAAWFYAYYAYTLVPPYTVLAEKQIDFSRDSTSSLTILSITADNNDGRGLPQE